MRSWFFTEMPYPFIPDEREYDSVRVTLPNRLFDPHIGADLYNRYYDEYALADDLGLDLMANEHHATPTCLDSTVPLTMAILARQTRKARILTLGVPIGNRPDPVRVAEELAMVDCISHGRLEAGFIRGVSTEVLPANVNPVGSAERMWEAHDLIVKAWTHHDGPFNFEGKYFHYRQVNIWPRPYQQPLPPIWITGTNPESVRRIAQRGYVLGTIVGGVDRTRLLFGAYRDECAQLGRPEPHPDRFGYAAFVYVGQTDSVARAGAEKMRWMLDTYKIPPHLSAPPGYAGLSGTVSGLRTAHRPWTGPSHGLAYKTVDELIDRGVMFAGSPDSVIGQISRFNEQVGGFGHLIMIGQAGLMSHEETVANLKLFAHEVYPALKQLDERPAQPAVA